MQQYIFEFIGTLVLVLLGDGVCAATSLKFCKAKGAGWVVIALGWGLAVMMGVLIAGPVSGAHLNPAVSFTYAIGQMAISETLDLPVASGNDGIKWDAGKVYVYSVQIQPESKISVSVEDWDSFYVSTDDVIFTD